MAVNSVTIILIKREGAISFKYIRETIFMIGTGISEIVMNGFKVKFGVHRF